MFHKNHTISDHDLDGLIADLAADLRGRECDTKEYRKVSEQYQNLMKLRASLNEDTRDHITAKDLLPIFGSLLGIILVLNYERVAVVTTKAWSLIHKI